MKNFLLLFITLTTFFSSLSASAVLYRDLKGHTMSVSSVDFSQKTSYLLSADLGGAVKIWDVDRNTCLLSINHGAAVECAVFSPDAKYFATAGRDNTLKLWETTGGNLIKAFDVFKEPLYSAAFSSDSKLLAVGTYRNISVFGVKDGKKYFEVPIGDLYARSIKFSNDGKFMAAGCGQSVILWEIDHKNLINSILGKGGVSFKQARVLNHGSLVYAAAFSADSQYVAAGGENRFLKFWRAEDGLLIWTNVAHENIIWGLVFSPDGSLLISSGKDTLTKIWDAKTGRLSEVISGHNDEVYSVSVSPGSEYLATACRDGSLKIWALKGLLANRNFKGITIVILLAILAALTAIFVINMKKRRKKRELAKKSKIIVIGGE